MPAATLSPVLLYLKVEGDPSVREDHSIAANYVIEVNGTVDPDTQADAALAIFHAYVPVSRKNDFTYEVFDAAGTRLADSGVANAALMDHGMFAGMIDRLPFEISAPAF